MEHIHEHTLSRELLRKGSVMIHVEEKIIKVNRSTQSCMKEANNYSRQVFDERSNFITWIKVKKR